MNSLNKIKINSLSLSNKYSLSCNSKSILFNQNSNLKLSIKSLNNIRKLSNLDGIKSVEEYYPGIKVLNISGSISYDSLIGKKKSIKYVKYLKSEIDKSIGMITEYHTDIFPVRKKCYLNLTNVMFDGRVLEKPVYNHSGVTGRTSITSGHNFLTMKKNDRKHVKSTKKDCALVEVDFKSCEPFFYLKSQGYDLSGVRDIYQWISDTYNVKMKSREKFKRGILSMLYGANEYTISKVMQVKQSTVAKIKEEIGINALNERLESEFNNKGYILNYYGRPITSNNNLVNYWIQSSTVDFCSLSFFDFYSKNEVKPAFFIHDSMTFEVSNTNLKNILTHQEISDPISNIAIPVEFNVIHE